MLGHPHADLQSCRGKSRRKYLYPRSRSFTGCYCPLTIMLSSSLLVLTIGLTSSLVLAGSVDLFPSDSLVTVLDFKGFRNALKENVRSVSPSDLFPNKTSSQAWWHLLGPRAMYVSHAVTTSSPYICLSIVKRLPPPTVLLHLVYILLFPHMLSIAEILKTSDSVQSRYVW